jgi:hypothetical protein
MGYAQTYCTVDELIADLELLGGDQDAFLRHVRAASQTIQQEIGFFIPVTESKKFNGRGQRSLFVPPLLAIVSIQNDDDTLVSTDYILQPDNRHWPNGPYSWLLPDPDSATLTKWLDEDEGVSIAGRWGLWEKSQATGATLGAALADTTGTSLQASDGSKVSPGMVGLIDSEQVLVTGVGSPTNVTTLNGAIDASQETITLANGALVNKGEIVRADVEQMKVLDVSGNTGYVKRAWNKTKAVSHLTGVNVAAYRTFTIERSVNGTTPATHLINAVINKYTVPDDVSFLCREIAALMFKKAQSAFAGRTGSAESGVTFYNDAFPRFDLERVRAHYRIGRR